MKYKYAFLLGRPGCGKSALYRELEKRILESGQAMTFERVDDFPKLWARLEGDDFLEKEGKQRLHSKRSDDGGYILYDHVFSDILKEVNSDVLKIDKPDHMIFLEFARPNYVEALQIFDKSILRNCIVIYMEVSFDTCWARNVARYEAGTDQSGDDHMVYREAMEKLYLYDDQDALVQHLKEQNIPVMVVNNEADGEEHLKKQVEALFRNLL
jgi:adenylate kinase family enzyme